MAVKKKDQAQKPTNGDRKTKRPFPDIPKPFESLFRARPRAFHSRPVIDAGRSPKPTDPQGSVPIQTICDLLERLANEQLTEACAGKEFVVESVLFPCSASTNGGAKAVDLVVLIDTSGSMSDEATNLSAAADAAIQEAQQKCQADLKVTWLGIEGTFAGTKFDTTIRDYLHGLGVPDSAITSRRYADINESAREDGARAIQDLGNHFKCQR